MLDVGDLLVLVAGFAVMPGPKVWRFRVAGLRCSFRKCSAGSWTLRLRLKWRYRLFTREFSK